LLETAIKWVVSIAIGVLFVWLSARDGQFTALLEQPVHFDLPYVVGGAFDPRALAEPGAAAVSALDAGALAEGRWFVDLRAVAVYLLVLIAIHFLRVWRWLPLLAPLDRVSFRVVNRVSAVGFMATFLFPLRLGELVRPYLIRRESAKIGMTSALATIVVERIMDGLLVSLLLFGVLVTLPNQAGAITEIRLGAYVALAVFVGGMATVVALYWQQDRAIRVAMAIVRPLSRPVAERVERLLQSFLRGLACLPSARHFLGFTAITAVYWGINGVGLWMLAGGFGLAIPLGAAYAMMSCVVVGMMIPNSPGNVGTFWYFLLLPLSLYGLSAQVAQVTLFGLVVYAMQLLQQSAFGAWYLVTGSVHAEELVSASHASVDEPG
jgi:uncharacterized protein (TIRG00374 family)